MMKEQDSLTIESLLNMLQYGTTQEKAIAQAVIETVAEKFKKQAMEGNNESE